MASRSRQTKPSPAAARVDSEAMMVAERLAGALEPRGEVHHVAHHRVVEALPRADVADQRFARVEPDALAQLAAERRAHAIEPREPRGALQRSPHRVIDMNIIIEWRAEHRDDRRQ
jgi:hypothetical protein